MTRLGRGLLLAAVMVPLVLVASKAEAKFFDLKGAVKVPPGAVVTRIGRQARVTTALAEPNGSVLVGGVTGSVLDNDGFITDSSFALVRYRPSGRLDRGFGKVTTSFGAPATLEDLVLQPDGKILAVGSVRAPSGTQIAMARYLPDGKLDQTFGQGGLVATGLGSNAGAGSVAIEGDGRIVVAGASVVPVSGSRQEVFMLARFNRDGSADQSFGSQGAVRTPFATHAFAEDLTILPNGEIEAVGIQIRPSSVIEEDIAAARYTPSGSMDTSFGDQGKLIVAFLAPSSQIRFTFYGPVGFAPDQKIIATGVPLDQQRQSIGAAVERLDVDGRPDPTFGSGGFSLFGEPGTDKQKARVINGMVVQQDGAVVLVGWPFVGPSNGLGLDRTNPNGGLDRRFTKHRPNGIYFQRLDLIPESATIDPLGRILVASTAATRRHRIQAFTISRFKASGSLDQRFGRR